MKSTNLEAMNPGLVCQSPPNLFPLLIQESRAKLIFPFLLFLGAGLRRWMDISQNRIREIIVQSLDLFDSSNRANLVRLAFSPFMTGLRRVVHSLSPSPAERDRLRPQPLLQRVGF